MAPNPEPTQEHHQEAAAAQDMVQEAGQEEEEGECGFCLYMKGGGCKDAFVAWEECVEAAEEAGADMVERCFEVTSNLKKCMEAHAKYYAPVLQAEQTVSQQAAAEEEKKEAVVEEEEKEKEKEKVTPSSVVAKD